jgi:hypothetical protein
MRQEKQTTGCKSSGYDSCFLIDFALRNKGNLQGNDLSINCDLLSHCGGGYFYLNTFQNTIKEIDEGRIQKRHTQSFGFGRFPELLLETLPVSYKELMVEACEPSEKNYTYFRE